MLLGYDWSEDHPQAQSPFFGQFFGLMNNPGQMVSRQSRLMVENVLRSIYRTL